ncbi:MAG TPA: hypothetical protein VG367_02795 [Mucilaginibacter sp.]|jgi:hypothetical protein|nr:hypothetical protein [Mucilaginibacter sp.]
MTPRDFFALILKIIGLYLIIGAFVSIPQVVASLLYSYKSAAGASVGEILEICFYVLFGLSFYIWFLYLCLFRTDWIINKLQLDQGFSEERFELNIHRSTVLKIAVIVIGAVLIIDNLPMLCKQLYSFIPSSEPRRVFSESPSPGWTVYYFVKFFIGFSLISANRPIVNYIERKRKGPARKVENDQGID